MTPKIGIQRCVAKRQLETVQKSPAQQEICKKMFPQVLFWVNAVWGVVLWMLQGREALAATVRSLGAACGVGAA